MKIAIVGSHGVGKTTFSRQIFNYLKGVIDVKIGITGSHSSGKTTLSKLLSGRLQLRFLPEVALQAMQIGFPFNEETGIETQLWILMKQIEQERYMPEPWISDKCMIDSLAYGLHLIDKTEYRDMMIDLVSRNAKYDHVFYLQIEFPIEDDGFRSLDPRFQSDVDKLIVQIMNDLGIKYHTITGSKEERFAKAKSILGL